MKVFQTTGGSLELVPKNEFNSNRQFTVSVHFLLIVTHFQLKFELEKLAVYQDTTISPNFSTGTFVFSAFLFILALKSYHSVTVLIFYELKVFYRFVGRKCGFVNEERRHSSTYDYDGPDYAPLNDSFLYGDTNIE